MNIARIVKSNSHVDYVARVADKFDAEQTPDPADYRFGQFVSLRQPDGTQVVGVIYNSELVNPDYANYGPRLAPDAAGKTYTPDVYFEQGTLISILLLGYREKDAGAVRQSMPPNVTSLNQQVQKMDDEAVLGFHRGENSEIQLHYYSQIVSHAEKFCIPLLEAIIAHLQPYCSEVEKNRLSVLQQSLAWQRTMGGMRL
jgi:hypothetical protein